MTGLKEREPRLYDIVITCREPGCPNFQTIHRDSDLPKAGDWMCQVCDEATEQQMLNELARREHEPMPEMP